MALRLTANRHVYLGRDGLDLDPTGQSLRSGQLNLFPTLISTMRKTSIYLSDEQADRLACLAQAEGRSQAEIIREAISAYRSRPNQDRNYAVAGNFERIDLSSRPISEISKVELMRGFGE